MDIYLRIYVERIGNCKIFLNNVNRVFYFIFGTFMYVYMNHKISNLGFNK